MISPTRTSHASGLPISSRDSTRVENVVPSPAAPAPAPLPAAEPCAPSPAEHPESPSADSAAAPASAANPRRVMNGYAISNPPFEGKGFTGKREGISAQIAQQGRTSPQTRCQQAPPAEASGTMQETTKADKPKQLHSSTPRKHRASTKRPVKAAFIHG